jgi:selenocysteine-specific elongation factor
MSYTIVGVIGHIDHGKTSLVTALTGVNTDTHPEEKLRGITIDLGFASFTLGEHRFALIDAPGHQKYIGNLLAGVSAVDVGLLVVACDQGIQAQTLEHAAILQSLGVSKLIVVLSRTDLVDAAMREALTEELDLFLADFGFHDIPKVSTSIVTGEGLDRLRSLLVQVARTAARTGPDIFRLPIDRVFTVEGRGCVIAGTIWSGRVAVGDHVQLLPQGVSARVRELEVHGQSVSQSHAGLRTAMNLVGVSATDIARGDELVAADTHRTSTRMLIELALFRDAAEIRCPSTVQLHTATSACAARITGAKRIRGGESAVVIVDAERPIVATFGQPCLLRKPYPVGSFAGGRVLACVDRAPRQTRRLLELGQRLCRGDAAERLAAWVDYRGELDVDPTWSELQLGIAANDLPGIIAAGLDTASMAMPVAGRLVSPQAEARIRRYVLKLLSHQAEATEDAWLVEESVWQRARAAGSPQVVGRVIDALVDEQALVRFNKLLAIASDRTVLSKKQRARMDQILAMFGHSRTPPTLKEAAAELQTTVDNVTSLIRFAAQQRVLIDLGGGFFIARAALEELCRELAVLFQSGPQQPVATIRDHWQMTRKHAIPILEYCDRSGLTMREGDLRSAGPELPAAITARNEARPTIESD